MGQLVKVGERIATAFERIANALEKLAEIEDDREHDRKYPVTRRVKHI